MGKQHKYRVKKYDEIERNDYRREQNTSLNSNYQPRYQPPTNYQPTQLPPNNLNISGNLYGVNFSATIDVVDTVNQIQEGIERKRARKARYKKRKYYDIEDDEYEEED